MKKRRRIAELEAQVKQLQEQVQAMELRLAAQPWPVVTPFWYREGDNTGDFPYRALPRTTCTGSTTQPKIIAMQ